MTKLHKATPRLNGMVLLYSAVLLWLLQQSLVSGLLQSLVSSQTGISPADWVNAHNQFRAKYNMPALQWSSQLQNFAQSWTDQEASTCVYAHSSSNYGENIDVSFDPPNATHEIERWGSESSVYNFQTMSCANLMACGHFTQLLWQTTQWVGCGVSASSGCQYPYYISCNYVRPGNCQYSLDYTSQPSDCDPLTISGVTVVTYPGNVTTSPGATTQFTAPVTFVGVTGQSSAVTWSANGGSVTTNGLYTAPATSGSYSVTATSVADSTVKSTSYVTVQSGGSPQNPPTPPNPPPSFPTNPNPPPTNPNPPPTNPNPPPTNPNPPPTNPNPPPTQPNGVTNLALNAHAVASTSYPNFGPNLAVNGITGSPYNRWCASSGASPQWLQVDLGSICNVTQTNITWYPPGAWQYNMDYSTGVPGGLQGGSSQPNGPTTVFNTDSVNALARYINVTILQNAAGQWASISQLQVYGYKLTSSPPPPAPQGRNLALNAHATASTSYTNYGPNLAVNGITGNPHNRWCAVNSAVPQWLQVDLGGIATVTQTNVTWYPQGAWQYHIQYWTGNPTDPKAVTSQNNGPYTSFNTDNVNYRARYINVTITQNAAGQWASISQIQVYGTM